MVEFDFDSSKDWGATLKRKGQRCFRWKVGYWFPILRVALAYGWQPIGTLAPSGVKRLDWKGDYLNNCRQQVTSDDAMRLAEALGKAVADIPTSMASSSSDIQPIALAYVEVHWRDILDDFVEFCRGGAFRITDDVCDG